jgi:hypothetical protein
VLGLVQAALDQIEAKLGSSSDAAAIRAAREILDRGLGKATQPQQVGASVEVSRAEAVAIAKEQLSIEMDQKAAGSREKLAQLLERRAREIAAGDGTSDRMLPHDLS